jgi:hypothetical protein
MLIPTLSTLKKNPNALIIFLNISYSLMPTSFKMKTENIFTTPKNQ